MNVTLYHGSPFCFKDVDLAKSKPSKDFGKGFYLADDKSYAIPIVFRNSKIGHLYTYEINIEDLYSLKVKEFDGYNMEWLDFVINCRTSCKSPHEYDVVIGKTADSKTKEIFKHFNEQIINKKQLLLELSKCNLGMQHLFNTEKSLKYLKLIDCEIVETD